MTPAMFTYKCIVIIFWFSVYNAREEMCDISKWLGDVETVMEKEMLTPRQKAELFNVNEKITNGKLSIMCSQLKRSHTLIMGSIFFDDSKYRIIDVNENDEKENVQKTELTGTDQMKGNNETIIDDVTKNITAQMKSKNESEEFNKDVKSKKKDDKQISKRNRKKPLKKNAINEDVRKIHKRGNENNIVLDNMIVKDIDRSKERKYNDEEMKAHKEKMEVENKFNEKTNERKTKKNSDKKMKSDENYEKENASKLLVKDEENEVKQKNNDLEEEDNVEKEKKYKEDNESNRNEFSTEDVNIKDKKIENKAEKDIIKKENNVEKGKNRRKIKKSDGRKCDKNKDYMKETRVVKENKMKEDYDSNRKDLDVNEIEPKKDEERVVEQFTSRKYNKKIVDKKKINGTVKSKGRKTVKSTKNVRNETNEEAINKTLKNVENNRKEDDKDNEEVANKDDAIRITQEGEYNAKEIDLKKTTENDIIKTKIPEENNDNQNNENERNELHKNEIEEAKKNSANNENSDEIEGDHTSKTKESEIGDEIGLKTPKNVTSTKYDESITNNTDIAENKENSANDKEDIKKTLRKVEKNKVEKINEKKKKRYSKTKTKKSKDDKLKIEKENDNKIKESSEQKVNVEDKDEDVNDKNETITNSVLNETVRQNIENTRNSTNDDESKSSKDDEKMTLENDEVKFQNVYENNLKSERSNKIKDDQMKIKGITEDYGKNSEHDNNANEENITKEKLENEMKEEKEEETKYGISSEPIKKNTDTRQNENVRENKENNRNNANEDERDKFDGGDKENRRNKYGKRKTRAKESNDDILKITKKNDKEIQENSEQKYKRDEDEMRNGTLQEHDRNNRDNNGEHQAIKEQERKSSNEEQTMKIENNDVKFNNLESENLEKTKEVQMKTKDIKEDELKNLKVEENTNDEILSKKTTVVNETLTKHRITDIKDEEKLKDENTNEIDKSNGAKILERVARFEAMLKDTENLMIKYKDEQTKEKIRGSIRLDYLEGKLHFLNKHNRRNQRRNFIVSELKRKVNKLELKINRLSATLSNVVMQCHSLRQNMSAVQVTNQNTQEWMLANNPDQLLSVLNKSLNEQVEELSKRTTKEVFKRLAVYTAERNLDVLRNYESEKCRFMRVIDMPTCCSNYWMPQTKTKHCEPSIQRIENYNIKNCRQFVEEQEISTMLLLGNNHLKVSLLCRNKSTVVLQRISGAVNFTRNWNDYKYGFGDLKDGFWIGLEVLYQLTSIDNYRLMITIHDWDNNSYSGVYGRFKVDSELHGYRLNIGEYSGDCGDGLSAHDNSKFSTIDVDNDEVVIKFGGSCSNRFRGGWWYYSCYKCNPTGVYYDRGEVESERFDGISWKPLRPPTYSFQRIVMSIQRI